MVPTGTSFCDIQREEAISTNSSFVPECDEQGNFKPVQCRKLGFGKRWRGFDKRQGRRGFRMRNHRKISETGMANEGSAVDRRGKGRGWGIGKGKGGGRGKGKGLRRKFLKYDQICWCVDPYTGEQNKFEVGFNSTQLECDGNLKIFSICLI